MNIENMLKNFYYKRKNEADKRRNIKIRKELSLDFARFL